MDAIEPCCEFHPHTWSPCRPEDLRSYVLAELGRTAREWTEHRATCATCTATRRRGTEPCDIGRELLDRAPLLARGL
jgi:hypothetical protein